jgi:hypothetical protein
MAKCTKPSCLQVQSAVRDVMPYISKCVFLRNHAQRSGGAISIRAVTGDAVISQSVLAGNTACVSGGAAAFMSTARVTLQGCTVANNSVVLQGCSAAEPHAWAAGDGGGVHHVRPLNLCHATSHWLCICRLRTDCVYPLYMHDLEKTQAACRTAPQCSWSWAPM